MYPNVAVIEELRKESKNRGTDLELLYVGSKGGMEKEIIEKIGVKILLISCGKLRRYFSVENFFDFFKVPVGVFQARGILKKFKPDVVFSKGGYVSFPVTVAAYSLKIPVVIHESDLIPGLANKLSFSFVDKICFSFEKTRDFFESAPDIVKQKLVLTGNPIRQEILEGNKMTGLDILGFDGSKPVIFVIGGSLGAMQINKLVWESLDILLKNFDIIHQVGKGNVRADIIHKNYKQLEFIDDELKDIYAACDIVVSRGGANSLAEIALLEKKALIIPLGTKVSRGDQLENASDFGKKMGWSVLIGEIDVNKFIKEIRMIEENQSVFYEEIQNGTKNIVNLIFKYE